MIRKGHWSEWTKNGSGSVSLCPTGGTHTRPPPFDLNLPEETGRGGKVLVSWTQRPRETGHSHMSQEDTLSTGAAAAAAAAEEAARKPPISRWTLRAGLPSMAAQTAGLESPSLWVVGAFERGWAGFPLTSNLQLQLGGMWPCGAVTKWSHSHFGCWPYQHHDRSLTLYKPSPTRSRTPHKRPVPGPCLCKAGPPGQVASSSEGDGRAQRPRRKQIQPRALSKSQGSFP